MKLSELWARAKAITNLEESKILSKLPQFKSEQTQIILKENKNNALIKCWKYGREVWTRKGFRCFKEGLCSKCVN